MGILDSAKKAFIELKGGGVVAELPPKQVQVGFGRDLEFEGHMDCDDEAIIRSLTGRKKPEGEETVKKVKVLLVPISEWEVGICTTDGMRCGTMRGKNAKTAQEALDVMSVTLRKQRREYRQAPIEFIFTAEAFTEWVEDETEEGSFEVVPEVTITVGTKLPVQMSPIS